MMVSGGGWTLCIVNVALAFFLAWLAGMQSLDSSFVLPEDADGSHLSAELRTLNVSFAKNLNQMAEI